VPPGVSAANALINGNALDLRHLPACDFAELAFFFD
jgi:hypothetical protein